MKNKIKKARLIEDQMPYESLQAENIFSDSEKTIRFIQKRKRQKRDRLNIHTS